MKDYHYSTHTIEPIKCQTFKIVQTSRNWDGDKKNKQFIALRKIEFFTRNHPEGLFKYWYENFDSIKTNKNANEVDPHLYPVKIITNFFSTEKINELNSDKLISCGEHDTDFVKISFLNGLVLLDGYRLQRRNDMYKMKGWNIYGETIDGTELLISSYIDNNKTSNHIILSEKIINKKWLKSIIINRTRSNWDTTYYLHFRSLEIFGTYIQTKFNN